jgi:hypothetical protein
LAARELAMRRFDATSVSHEFPTRPDETHDIVRYAMPSLCTEQSTSFLSIIFPLSRIVLRASRPTAVRLTPSLTTR